jgi:hypothetical protein
MSAIVWDCAKFVFIFCLQVPRKRAVEGSKITPESMLYNDWKRLIVKTDLTNKHRDENREDDFYIIYKKCTFNTLNQSCTQNTKPQNVTLQDTLKFSSHRSQTNLSVVWTVNTTRITPRSNFVMSVMASPSLTHALPIFHSKILPLNQPISTPQPSNNHKTNQKQPNTPLIPSFSSTPSPPSHSVSQRSTPQR